MRRVYLEFHCTLYFDSHSMTDVLECEEVEEVIDLTQWEHPHSNEGILWTKEDMDTTLTRETQHNASSSNKVILDRFSHYTSSHFSS